MELRDECEVRVTREKLRELEAHYALARQEPGPLSHAREVSLRAVKRMINQMKEELTRFESRALAANNAT